MVITLSPLPQALTMMTELMIPLFLILLNLPRALDLQQEILA
jgi:hypothetical protein